MKILISSYPFYPSIGGVEEVTWLLAHEYVSLGHTVKIVTVTPASAPDNLPFEIIRRPTAPALVRAVRWCDVYVQHQISLRFAWPLLIVRRPWVVAQLHTLGDDPGWRARWKRKLKRATIRLSHHAIACSHAMAKEIGSGARVILNPYRDRLFQRIAEVPRNRDLVFLGRLVSDKGVHLLLDALSLIRDRGLTPSLLIIGDGPDAGLVRSRCDALGIARQVELAGYVPENRLVELLNQCRIMVIPSTVEEGFGIVALEGIACGCVVVAARAGGLPDAVGPCGMLFDKGDVPELAECLAALLGDPEKVAGIRAKAASHLTVHGPRAVAEAYLAVLDQAFRGRRT
jgi:glycogen synthase